MLLASASFQGKAEMLTLIIEEGAFFQGECRQKERENELNSLTNARAKCREEVLEELERYCKRRNAPYGVFCVSSTVQSGTLWQ